MSIVPAHLSERQWAIVRGLQSGENVEDIALRLNTTPQYVYNTTYQAKRMGITINPPNRYPQQNIQQPEQAQPPRDIEPGLAVGTTCLTQPPMRLHIVIPPPIPPSLILAHVKEEPAATPKPRSISDFLDEALRFRVEVAKLLIRPEFMIIREINRMLYPDYR